MKRGSLKRSIQEMWTDALITSCLSLFYLKYKLKKQNYYKGKWIEAIVALSVNKWFNLLLEQHCLCGSPVFCHYIDSRLNWLHGSSLSGTSVPRMTDGHTGKPQQCHYNYWRPRKFGMSLLWLLHRQAEYELKIFK